MEKIGIVSILSLFISVKVRISLDGKCQDCSGRHTPYIDQFKNSVQSIPWVAPGLRNTGLGNGKVPMKERTLAIPDIALIAGTRIALGVGIGLLLSDKLSDVILARPL